MLISDKPVQITEDGSCDDGVIFSDKAVVVSQDERPGLGQGQEEADLLLQRQAKDILHHEASGEEEAEAGRVWGGALLCGGVVEDGLSVRFVMLYQYSNLLSE